MAVAVIAGIDVSLVSLPLQRSFVEFFLSLHRESSFARPKETRIFELLERTTSENLRPLFLTRNCYIANRQGWNWLFAFCLRVATFIEADTYASTRVYNANGALDRFTTERTRYLEIYLENTRVFSCDLVFFIHSRFLVRIDDYSISVRLGRDERLSDFLLRRRA